MAVIIQLRVTPRSSRQTVVLDASGVLKCFVHSAAEDGKANKEVVKVLAGLLRLPQGALSIVAGETSRSKRISIETSLSQQEVIKRLVGEVQDALF